MQPLLLSKMITITENRNFFTIAIYYLNFNRNEVGWLTCGVEHHFQQYFSYIMAVSFIGGGNQSTRGKTTDLSQVADKFIT